MMLSAKRPLRSVEEGDKQRVLAFGQGDLPAAWIRKGGVRVTEARRYARPPCRERRSMPRECATRPRQQSVSACRLAASRDAAPD
jgi:hypothetical protein